MFDRKLWRNFDYPLLIIMLLICAYGLLVISSATQNYSEDPLYYVRKQAVLIVVGLAAIIFLLCIDYSNFSRLSRYLYVGNIVLLILVLFIGKETAGSQRWIDLKFFDLQPSEFAKLIVIITLARYLESKEGELDNPLNYILAFIHIALPMVLIFKQPDFGTSLIFLAILFGMLFMAGAKIKHLLITVLLGVLSFPLLWMNLKDYQKMRLIIFANPEMDPLHYGYQLIQSVIAIGSGKEWGKGLFAESTQNMLNFLPAQHTDFIFSVLGEGLGFVGGVALLLLYLLLIFRILKIAMAAKDTFGFLICTGVASMFIFQILINIGMTMSIMPVTGLPLPFMSYGGSSLLVNMSAVGLVLNVGLRRQKILF